MRRQKLSEAATIKARARRLIRDLDELMTDKALPEGLRRQVEELRTSLKKTWAQLEREAVQDHGRRAVAAQSKEATVAKKTKTVGGKSVPASSFLVTEDPESPSTWHLQVKDENGKPDHRLMGAAWAALHNGYRGNKYEGPSKAAALKMLKAMYDDEGMAMPAENAESEEVAEYSYDSYAGGYTFVPTNIISFAQLETAEAAQEIAHEMREAVEQFQGMLSNIFFWSSSDQVPDKIGAAQNLFDEFVGVMANILGGNEAGTPVSGGSAEAEPAGDPEQFSESFEQAVTIVEAGDSSNPRGPLEMDVQLIQPGWGNQRDNHYYPAEMLRRCAEVFVGAKMYSTDHRPEEKSVRTEVSKIRSISGFSEAGAPIARVIVFDPEFAEKARNRAKAGVLDSLECSILADGRARPGFEEGGRKGKVVESITSVSSVDWVTRAGAGGRALSLAENDAQPETVSIETPVVEAQSEEPVAIREQDGQAETPAGQPENVSVETPDAGQPDPAAPAPETAQPEQPAAESAAEAPVSLGEAEIREALAKTNLPAVSVLQLAFGKYESTQALQEAINAEIKRLKEVSGSGRPFGLGESAPVSSPPASREKIEEVMDQINSRFGFGR